jgi:hypothetical protein
MISENKGTGAVNHSGEKYLEALVLYGHSKNVLSGNTFELRRFTEELECGKLRNLYKSQEFRDKIFSMNGHLLRYIHNFLSSHMTYVEHVRVLMGKEDRHLSFIRSLLATPLFPSVRHEDSNRGHG